MPFVDTHCHLDEHAFDEDRESAIERAREAGVAAMLSIGINAKTSANAVELATQHDDIYAVVGIQPNYVSQAEDGDWERVLELAGHEKVVGIGETGLDRYWDYAPIEEQSKWFYKHIELAQELKKPFIVHCREAEADVVEHLNNAAGGGSLTGVMHSFCGDQQTADACLKLGMHISFAGMLTFKKNQDLRAVAATIPHERLLVETDSPYLSPEPNRGKRNEPANVVHTCRVLGEQVGLDIEEMAAVTTKNAAELFGLVLE
ncbi:TatD family hydrolase [Stratiformator vulcanicus]|uniref:Putative deoxyribonuclease YcfH n=1 Tax=Stratiformator vulcanicus TaxID=2527980 RepID=A0A517R033_9PLAN|nr:TatD family hydrolase [Stratiformator vulcanicus]QDT37184.1 putative deoxyribonuclease YcfH [Stratiformator vulcanicus]